MKNSKLVIELDEKTAAILRACAAFDETTPEQFARAALMGNLQCCAEAIGAELQAA